MRERSLMSSSLSPQANSGTLDSTDPLLCQDAIALVRRWLREARSLPTPVSARRLAGVLKDSGGLPFTVDFVDTVVRPEDTRIAARNLHDLAPRVPGFLPALLRAEVRLGGMLAPVLPGVVVPIARRVLRSMVHHLIIDSTDARLGSAIRRIRGDGIRLNMNLLGEAVLGREEATRRLTGTMALLERDDVDYVSIKVSATVAPHNPWAFSDAVTDIVTHLTPVFARAAAAPTPKFINLDMEEYKDLDLTIAVFTRLLDTPEFLHLEAGIVLQAYLPDALDAMMHLQEWSAQRRARGGAPIKVRLVKGANLPMERVEASLHGWPLATWDTKVQTDTNYKRVVDYALTPERIANVRVGLAGHNLFDIAYSWLLAGRRGVRDGIDYEMLLGMAQAQAEVVRREVGSLLLYTPVVSPREFDVAIAYLVRRLEEGASDDNFMSAVYDLNDNEDLFRREEERFLDSVRQLDREVPQPHRSTNRCAVVPPSRMGSFHNTPDTDPAVPDYRRWATEILLRVPESKLGCDLVAQTTLHSRGHLDQIVTTTRSAAPRWAACGGLERARILHRAGTLLEEHRAELIEVAAAEAGKTFDQADPEVSEAVDFAHYYAERASELETIDGARFVPAALTLVTPPWNFPLAIPAGGVLAALASGSGVIFKPASLAARCGALIADILWQAGVPRDVLSLVQTADDEFGSALVQHAGVDRVILTGAFETAALFRSLRNDLPLLAETSGKNAIIVTPSADRDLAVKDIVSSAFGHAGQKCSAASLVVLVGSMASSERFLAQLRDAVVSLTVGYPSDPRSQVGPLIEPAAGKLLRGLTVLEAGQSWLVQPKQLDKRGMLWSPGIRLGVARGSEYHRTEYFGPVLGIMTARTLREAIEIVNEVDYGLTSGLHALDRDEIDEWLRGVQAGNLYVNRGITGAIVQRQPFGGWKKSSVGPGTKAGGPNYLLGLGRWESQRATVGRDPDDARIVHLVDVCQRVLSTAEADAIRRAVRSDAGVRDEMFAAARDVSNLFAERNVFRYLPFGHDVLVRLAPTGSVADMVRVVAAGVSVGARLCVSSAVPLPGELRTVLAPLVSSINQDDEAAWLSRVRDYGSGRVRLIGEDAGVLQRATGGRPDLAVYDHPVTESGRVEALPFLLEQAVSITAHRFGTPNHLTDQLI